MNNRGLAVYQTRYCATASKSTTRCDANRFARNKWTMVIQWCLAFILLCSLPSAHTAELRIAVATNFSRVATQLADQFERRSGHTVRLAFGSTGKHYAQIKHGAPFDIFFAADEHRPTLLEEEGIAVPGTRFTYAQGKLVLWSPDENQVNANADVLSTDNFRKLAIANPKLAPYGLAAREVLQAHDFWKKLQPRLVRGENIGQAYQFVRTGNAQLGFVAAAQLISDDNNVVGSHWEPPQSLYTPITQQAILIKDTPAARAFTQFVKSNLARSIIRKNGYTSPEH